METTLIVSYRFQSINMKLSMLEVVHTEFIDLKASKEFSQLQIKFLIKDELQLKGQKTNNSSSSDNKILRDIIRPKIRWMRENPVFPGIFENNYENAEEIVKYFKQTKRQIPADEALNIVLTESTEWEAWETKCLVLLAPSWPSSIITKKIAG